MAVSVSGPRNLPTRSHSPRTIIVDSLDATTAVPMKPKTTTTMNKSKCSSPSSSIEKSVSFGNQQDVQTFTKETISREDFKEHEWSAYWYTGIEIAQIRKNVKTKALKVKDLDCCECNIVSTGALQHQEQSDDDTASTKSSSSSASSSTPATSNKIQYSCARGVIEYSQNAMIQRHRIRKTARTAVFLEQEHQKKKGIYSAERIGACYQKQTLSSQLVAHQTSILDKQKLEEECQCTYCCSTPKTTRKSQTRKVKSVDTQNKKEKKAPKKPSSFLSFFRGSSINGSNQSNKKKPLTSPRSYRVQPIPITSNRIEI